MPLFTILTLDPQMEDLDPAIRASGGATVAAKYVADGKLYRARICGTLVNSLGGYRVQVVVMYVDFGNMAIVFAEELVEVPEHLQEERWPGLAKKVEVAGGHLLPTTEEARQLLESRLDGEEVAMTRDQAGRAAFLVDGVRLEVEDLLDELARGERGEQRLRSQGRLEGSQLAGLEEVERNTYQVLNFKY